MSEFARLSNEPTCLVIRYYPDADQSARHYAIIICSSHPMLLYSTLSRDSLVPDSLVPKLHIWSENMESILVVKQA
jgi:hypothetical protein